MVSEVPSPGPECANPESAESIPSYKYSVNVKNSFSLIIHLTTPADSSDYKCVLLVVDPASSNGATLSHGESVPVTLSVGGKSEEFDVVNPWKLGH